MSTKKVRTGLERLLADECRLLAGRRVALLAHPASVDPELRNAVELMWRSSDVRLELLLGPEHGIRGEAQDMEPVSASNDPLTGLPVVSLYGTDPASLRPAATALENVDVLVVDLQDVGARYYTYVWTALACLETAAQTSTEVIVCDRPNPLGGLQVEGGGLATHLESFVGGHNVAVRHGLTAAEILAMAADERKIDTPLHVVAMEGFNRRMRFADTGLPWVMPSPNMPTVDTATVYPGTCLLEATELSEGRGTTRPFELAGAPFADAHNLARTLSELNLPGVRFRPANFKPTFQKHAGLPCAGVQIHVESPDRFKPYLTGVCLLWAFRHLWPESFKWRTAPYEFVTRHPAIDLLSGSEDLRTALEAGAHPTELQALWVSEQDEFARRRKPYLRYPEES